MKSVHLLLALAATGVGCGADPAPTSGPPLASTPAAPLPPTTAVERPLATMAPATAPGSSATPLSSASTLDPIVGCLGDGDCAWGEIGREIESNDDCMCLFGCPHLPMNVPTVKRRAAQYSTHCRPGFAANGRRCPIDDCAMPPPVVCRENVCQAR